MLQKITLFVFFVVFKTSIVVLGLKTVFSAQLYEVQEYQCCFTTFTIVLNSDRK